MYLSASPGYTIPIIKNILQNLYTLQTLESEKKPAASEIATLRAGIPQAMLRNYDRMRVKGRKGIALVRNHVCTNCRIQVPVAVTASLMNGTLIQVCGRAARNVNGRVILYADKVTGSMKRALDEMERRRVKQLAHNEKHHITPQTIKKSVQDLEEFQVQAYGAHISPLFIDQEEPLLHPERIPDILRDLETQMKEAADTLHFELAALLRDKINEIRQMVVQRNELKKTV